MSATFAPTDEQRAFIRSIQAGHNSTTQAGAGCGKSTTLVLGAEATDANGIILAFNKNVAKDMEKKISHTSTTARTTHSLAYGWTISKAGSQGKAIIRKLKNSAHILPRTTASGLNIKPVRFAPDYALSAEIIVKLAKDTLEQFMRSADGKVLDKHFRGDVPPQYYKKVREVAVSVAQKLWADMLDPNSHYARVTHDTYLKFWSLAKPELPYELIMLDEAQDTNPATKSVLDAQSAQMVVVGDSAQQLFRWTGAINVMDSFEGDRLTLTKSWRFGKAIEDAANTYLTLLGAPIRLMGNYNIASALSDASDFDPAASTAILTRTNADAINAVIEQLSANKRVYLVGGSEATISLVKAVKRLKDGKKVSHQELMAFPTYADLQDYVNDDESGKDLRSVVNLIEQSGADTLINALERCVSSENRADVTISTVHKVKGREWDQVQLYGDFITSSRRRKDEIRVASAEELMLNYVAATRAKKLLDPGVLQSDLKMYHPQPITSQAPPREVIHTPQSQSVSVSLPLDTQTKLLATAGGNVQLSQAVKMAIDAFIGEA